MCVCECEEPGWAAKHKHQCCGRRRSSIGASGLVKEEDLNGKMKWLEWAKEWRVRVGHLAWRGILLVILVVLVDPDPQRVSGVGPQRNVEGLGHVIH